MWKDEEMVSFPNAMKQTQNLSLDYLVSQHEFEIRTSQK